MQPMTLFEVPEKRPIQDFKGEITFSLGNTTYKVNPNSERERKSLLKQINAISPHKWDWFHEDTGNCHWVLYDTEMYQECINKFYQHYLHYIEDCGLDPVMPFNASSCYKMFADYRILNEIDFSNFDTSNIITMESMFECSIYLEHLDLSTFNTKKLRNMNYMFCKCTYTISINLSSFNTEEVDLMAGVFRQCKHLEELDLRNFSTVHVTDMDEMFSRCFLLKSIRLDNFDFSQVRSAVGMFFACEELRTIVMPDINAPRLFLGRTGFFHGCYLLPNYDTEHANIDMAKSVEEGGYIQNP